MRIETGFYLKFFITLEGFPVKREIGSAYKVVLLKVRFAYDYITAVGGLYWNFQFEIFTRLLLHSGW